jgi:hypothetical protein
MKSLERLVLSRDLMARESVEPDQDNALKAWPEHGPPATLLVPNKNGKNW